jgi:cytochrome b subunit of formate dehydrogenase
MEVAIPLEAEAAVPARMQYRRFSAFQRWVHFFVMFSFTILVFTGMPLKYSDQGWARWAMGLYGGVQMAGIIHRFAALILVACVVSMLVFFARILVRTKGRFWGPGTMVPVRRDLDDLKAMVRWFIGGPRPMLKLDRYAYWEKFEFWAASAGVTIMVVTGAIMWYPVLTTRFVPGIVLNFAIVNHSGGALLAMGFVFVFWHVFHAHFRPEVFPMDKAMFDGSLPVGEYAHERPLEYERRVHEGTLHEVLVEPVSEHAKAMRNVLWWTITIAAISVWLAFTLFVVWVTANWIGLF